MIDFTFNGQTSAQLGVKVMDVRRPLAADRDITLLSVPGREGDYFVQRTTKPKEIEVDVALVSDSETNIQTAVRTLAGKLASTAPVALTFTDEPDLQYNAIYHDSTNLSRLAIARRGTLKFLCPDPFAYDITEDSTAVSEGANTLSNSGSALTFPRFEMVFDADCNMIEFEHESGQLLRLGAPNDAGVTQSGGWVTELNDNCGSLTGWSTGVYCDGGSVTGTMATNGSTFSPLNSGGSWGTGSTWHGPNIRKTITTAPTNFMLDVALRLDIHGGNNCVGKLDIYLLDDTATRFARISVYDAWASSKAIKGQVQLGSAGATTIMSNQPISSSSNRNITAGGVNIWQDFNGHVTLQRFNNNWFVEFTRSVSSTTTYRGFQTSWYDAGGLYTSKTVKYIEIWAAQYGTNTVPNQALFTNINLQRYSTPTGPQYIIKDGDVVVVDHHNANILKNGLPWMTDLDPSSQFWPLNLGANNLNITVEPSGCLTTSAAYVRNRWY